MRIGFRRRPAVNPRTRDAGDDCEHRCRTRPLLVGPDQGQANRPALCLGFTSGMPFLLTYSTQSAWLTDAWVPLATIGLLSELTLA